MLELVIKPSDPILSNIVSECTLYNHAAAMIARARTPEGRVCVGRLSPEPSS